METKAVYDIYGEYGLKEGCVNERGCKCFRIHLCNRFGFNLLSFLEKIGGGYFLRISPENYYEEKLQSTDFILDDRAVNGADAQQSIFADSFGGLN